MNKFQYTLIGIIIALTVTLIHLDTITTETIKLSKKYEEAQQKNYIEHLILEDNGGVVPDQNDIPTDTVN